MSVITYYLCLHECSKFFIHSFIIFCFYVIFQVPSQVATGPLTTPRLFQQEESAAAGFTDVPQTPLRQKRQADPSGPPPNAPKRLETEQHRGVLEPSVNQQENRSVQGTGIFTAVDMRVKSTPARKEPTVTMAPNLTQENEPPGFLDNVSNVNTFHPARSACPTPSSTPKTTGAVEAPHTRLFRDGDTVTEELIKAGARFIEQN